MIFTTLTQTRQTKVEYQKDQDIINHDRPEIDTDKKRNASKVAHVMTRP